MCKKLCQFSKGLFYHNNGTSREGLENCKGVRCGTFYSQEGVMLCFHIAEPMNNEGVVLNRNENKNRFSEGREGNILILLFQCDWCWFINLKGSTPEDDTRVD